MRNNKIEKQMASFGTQFTSQDIFYEQEQQNSNNKDVQNFYEKDPEQFDSKNQANLSIPVSKSEKQSKKSMNHNFQKHSVVTIKKILRVKCDSNSSEQEKLAHKLWKTFMLTDDKSKRLLVILFGKANFSDEKNKRLFVKCGFQQILGQQQILVNKAQEFLRRWFLETVTQQVVRQNILKFRNIKMRQEFLVYFSELVQLIRKGVFVKLRINTNTVKKVQSRLQRKSVSKENFDFFEELLQ